MPQDAKALLSADEHVATITLNRPDKLNAVDSDMLAGPDDVLAEIDADPDCRVVLVTGAGDRAFCAGADISAWGAMTPLGMWHTWVRRGHQIFDRLAGPAAAQGCPAGLRRRVDGAVPCWHIRLRHIRGGPPGTAATRVDATRAPTVRW